MEDIYQDIGHIDLGDEILKLEEQNKTLAEHICKLEGDIKRLCTELINMKEIQKNLSRNISELFKTAKMEIQRKDRIISDLRQEIDDMTLRRGFTFNKSKRLLPEDENNEDCKRFKNNSHENKNVQINKKDGSPIRRNKTDVPICKDKKGSSSSRSTPDSIKVDNYQNEDKRMSSRDKCYKNDDDFRRKSRYPSPTNFRRNMKSDNRRRPDNRYIRSRSNDRQSFREKRNNEDRRSRSNERYGGNRRAERYNRNRSNNRREDSKDMEQSDPHQITGSRFNRSRSKSCAGKKTPSRDLASTEGHKLEYRKKNINLNTQNSKSKTNEIFCLIEDSLEEGEITGESDNLVIEEPSRKTNYVTDEKTKSLTIEEYRDRRTARDTEAGGSNIPSQTTVKESDKKPIDTDKIIDLLNIPFKNSENSVKILLQNNIKEPKSHTENDVQAEITFKSTDNTDDTIKTSTEGIKTVIEEVQDINCIENSKKVDNTCEHNNKQSNDSSLNDSTNSTSKLFSGDDSKISNNSSLVANNDSTGSHNNSINTSIRQRRRRCVVIGLKEK